MADSKSKSFAGQIQLLMETEPDFPQRFKQRLVLESSKVASPIKFMVELFSKGVLCDGSDKSGASFGLKETMVQLALLIVSSKGADAMGGLMEALEESDNSEIVSALRAWVAKDFDIQTDDVDRSEAKGDCPSIQAPASEITAKPQEIPNEFSSSGTKLIDKLMSHDEKDFMEQLEAYLLGKASQIVKAEEFCSILVNLNVLEKSGMELKPGQELEPGQWTEKAIKAACSKKATGSLVLAFQRSGNELIVQETYDWLETPRIRQKNYPISVKTLASQRSKEEPTVARPTFFEQAVCTHGLSKLATFKCHQKSGIKGVTAVQFDRERMMACGADGTLSLWNRRCTQEEPIKIAVDVKNITCFHYDEEILVLGTAHGSVHLFDMRIFEEKSSVKLNDEAVISLKFIQSTVGVVTAGRNQVWWMEISRPDMRILNQRCFKTSGRVKSSFLEVHMLPDTSFVCGPNYVDVFDTKSGQMMKDDKKRPCSLIGAPPSGTRTLNIGNLDSGKIVAFAGGQNGAISMWNTSKLWCEQNPFKTFRAHDTAMLSLCLLNGHLLSLGQDGKLLMWSGLDLGKKIKQAPRILLESSTWTHLAAHERLFATCSSNDDMINIWTVPDSWLRTGGSVNL